MAEGIKRPTKHEHFFHIAGTMAERATCLRRRYGAIIVKDGIIVGTGYCGAPRGATNCCDHGYCQRKERGAKHGEHYEWCVSVHAEANAIINSNVEDRKGGVIYVCGYEVNERSIAGEPLLADSEPCEMCMRMIINAQLNEIIYYNPKTGELMSKLVELRGMNGKVL